jgi:hypothetical protein
MKKSDEIIPGGAKGNGDELPPSGGGGHGNRRGAPWPEPSRCDLESSIGSNQTRVCQACTKLVARGDCLISDGLSAVGLPSLIQITGPVSSDVSIDRIFYLKIGRPRGTLLVANASLIWALIRF